MMGLSKNEGAALADLERLIQRSGTLSRAGTVVSRQSLDVASNRKLDFLHDSRSLRQQDYSPVSESISIALELLCRLIV